MLKNKKKDHLKQIFTLFSYLPDNYVYVADEMKRFLIETEEQETANLQTIREPILRAISNCFKICQMFV